ncbi:glycosyltransferase family 2 protein [Suillus plorans]|uniref:Glycosyltransferase family 2 protein n=1 Tax=Suillus plorans TaxID=116603 RepID=A0A9P7DSQ3_9AGAM|nr:glycosyltransferase family 2 protein [Suillus plorans]KAG1802208.1 glycosyltransferase family 2 protein [Suillus plorans]
MTFNLIHAAVHRSVQRFLYASSACFYPTSLQHHGTNPISLREHEVWSSGAPNPQGLYGLEKLNSELLLMQFLRKALAAFMDPTTQHEIEIWGDAKLPLHRQLYMDDSRPVGVHSRNSNNEFITKILSWTPKISLEAGMMKTANRIRGEMEKMLNGTDKTARTELLSTFKTSKVVYLNRPTITFAIILPITSRGLEGPEKSLENLRTFAKFLAHTTWRYTRELGLVHFQEGITDVSTEICNVPRGHVCAIWRQCARRAWKEKADYFVLMGDDVVLLDEGWMRDIIHEQFTLIAQHEHVPQGMGCVAFTDVTFPGMPTFPVTVIHRTHMNAFGGQVIPNVFINQDADPFLFQLYRKWGCSIMIPSRLCNGIGGSLPARYIQQHADGWTFGPLTEAASALETSLATSFPAATRKMTLDIIIPSYLVLLPFLDAILALKESPTCETMFIIIDNPHCPKITELEAKYAHRPDIRIRINESNLGASASRNRGMKESAADWILFLDDDVTPQDDILIEAEKAIRANPQADENESDMPWGVTANLIARRVQDGVEFDLQVPKRGGGEDIDFCRKKRDFSVAHGGEGFYPAPRVIATHPWWKNGQRSYWRFYMWSKGDGGLMKLYPNLTLSDSRPGNSALNQLNSWVQGERGTEHLNIEGGSNYFPTPVRYTVQNMLLYISAQRRFYLYKI